MIDNFSFVVPSILAGSALPKGDAKDLATELQRIGAIKTVVNLTETAHPSAQEVEQLTPGVRFVHMPIEDFDRPSLQQMQAFADLVMIEEARPVLVHCRAGIGRTGTMLAVGVAQLEHSGQIEPFPEGTSAVEYVRARRKAALEVEKQMEAAQEFFNTLKTQKP